MKYLVAIALILIPSISLAKESNLRTVTEQFQDWQLLCQEKAGNKQCRMTETLANEKGQTIAIINLVKKDGGQHIIEIVLPLQLDLSKKVDVNIKGQKSHSYGYSFCNNTACFVLINDDKALLTAFKKGTKGSIGITPFTKKPIKFNFSLNGFSSAFEALSNAKSVK